MKTKPTRKIPGKKQARKKLSKSTIVYIWCGVGAFLLVIGMLLIYAAIEKVDIIAWLGSKYAGFIYLALFIYLVIGIILFVKDKIARM